MSDFVFLITTYKRSEKQPTLEMLEKLGVPKENIYMSVQTEEDRDKYTEMGYPSRVGRFVYKKGRNRSDNLNALIDIVPIGAKMVLMDDDIKNVGKLVKDQLKPIETLDEFYAFLNRGFALARKYNTIGFSVYPCYNAFFMSNKDVVRNIGEGTLLGVINKGLKFRPDFFVKEDYEFTCRVITRYGAFPRMNYYACNAPHYSNGGCKEFWEKKGLNAQHAQRLVKMYPSIVTLNPRRAGEVKMVKGAN